MGELHWTITLFLCWVRYIDFTRDQFGARQYSIYLLRQNEIYQFNYVQYGNSFPFRPISTNQSELNEMLPPQLPLTKNLTKKKPFDVFIVPSRVSICLLYIVCMVLYTQVFCAAMSYQNDMAVGYWSAPWTCMKGGRVWVKLNEINVERQLTLF